MYVDSYFFHRLSDTRVKESPIFGIGVASWESHLAGPRIPWVLTPFYHEKPQIICLFLEEYCHGASRLLRVGVKGLLLTSQR